MRIYLSPPDVGELERAYVYRALTGGWVAPAGPDLAAFEAAIAESIRWPGAVALSSGTAALHLALLAVGVQPGDDVICSTFTFAATANAIRYCGANPVFIDSEPSSWNMCPEPLAWELAEASRRGRLPSAVVIVDLYGQCADFERLLPICREYGVPIVEDAAEALGASCRLGPAGALGDVGVFSFNGNKIMTTSGGGMLVAPTTEIADRVRYLSTQARQPVTHYEHTEVGFNYRLSNILAALGRAQFERLPAMIARRLEINRLYRDALGGVPGLTFMPVPEWSHWNGWLTCVLLESPDARDAVMAALAAEGIESRPLWKPMHEQPAFAGCRSLVNGVSSGLFATGLCLPSGSVMTDRDVAEVASLVVGSMSHLARS